MISSCFRKGVGNIIGKNVKIHENVRIGNNNRIFDGTTLYPNTVIGDNNVILNGNTIGEHPVNANENLVLFEKNYEKGVVIGSGNLFHVNNIIFAGIENPTRIGNHNKLLAENHIGHDTNIEDRVTIYPRCITGGYSALMSDSNMGFYSTIQQRKKLGNYSMLGAGNNASKDVFPFYIQVNNKYLRLNRHAIPDSLNVEAHDEALRSVAEKYKNMSLPSHVLSDSKLPKDIYDIVHKFVMYST
jgi:acyl-[acyl carrier protein]--UDP-N-acetylglucosamine O-acyltransferase